MENVFIVYFENRDGERSACVEDNTILSHMVDYATELYKGMSNKEREQQRVIVVQNTLAFEDEGTVVWTSDVDYDGWNSVNIEKLLEIEREALDSWEFDVERFHDCVSRYPQGEAIHLRSTINCHMIMAVEDGDDSKLTRLQECMIRLNNLMK